MNILITGSSGFIANHLAQELSHKNIIFGVDLKKSTNTKIICDVRNKLENKKLPKKIDLIINLKPIQKALEQGGVEFIGTPDHQPGVRLK